MNKAIIEHLDTFLTQTGQFNIQSFEANGILAKAFPFPGQGDKNYIKLNLKKPLNDGRPLNKMTTNLKRHHLRQQVNLWRLNDPRND